MVAFVPSLLCRTFQGPTTASGKGCGDGFFSVMDSPGKRLKQERELQNLSLDEVSKSTRIQKHFLKAMEEDRFDLCPPPFYVKGFLANYARYLGLNPRDILFKYQKCIKPSLPSPEVSPQKGQVKTFQFHRKIRTRNPARTTHRLLLASVLFVSFFLSLYFYIALLPLSTSNAPLSGPQTVPTSEVVQEKGNPPVLEQIKQMELIGPQKVHAEPFYEVSDAYLGTGIEMEGGRPRVVGKGSEFICANQRIYFFTRIEAPKEGKIWHIWRWEGKEHHRIEMAVKPPSWSVYSYVSLPPARSGNWRVEVWDGDKMLMDVGFKATYLRQHSLQPNLRSCQLLPRLTFFKNMLDSNRLSTNYTCLPSRKHSLG